MEEPKLYSRIVPAVEQLVAAFKKYGLKPPKAIAIEHDDGIALLAYVRERITDGDTGMPDPRMTVDVESGERFVEVLILGVRVVWEARRYSINGRYDWY